MNSQHKRQTPPLRLLPGLRIEIRYIIRIRRLGLLNPLSSKIREIGDLIREHLIHALFGQDLVFGRGRGAVVEQRGEDLHVVGGSAETAGPCGVIYAGDFCWRSDEWAPVEVVSRPYVAGGLLVHVG